jgi:hypothetical protein
MEAAALEALVAAQADEAADADAVNGTAPGC